MEIKKIYGLFLKGFTPDRIAFKSYLTNRNIKNLIIGHINVKKQDKLFEFIPYHIMKNLNREENDKRKLYDKSEKLPQRKNCIIKVLEKIKFS